MKQKLVNFLNSVAKLSQAQQPALATATNTPITNHPSPITPSAENIDRITASVSTAMPEPLTTSGLTNYPPVEKWDDWVEYDSKAWPKKVARHYM
ncbi:MAG: hypothetical protein KDJ52_36510, partial [Anaerolineae bacterium]|nr:hypothetical protein [Anaerolineae bacterium]